MKKLQLLFAAFLLLAAPGVFAKIQIAPQAGVNWSKYRVDLYSYQQKVSPVIGYNIGAILDFQGSKYVHFQTGISFSQGGFKSANSYPAIQTTYSVRLTMIQIPLEIERRGDVFIFGGGLYAGRYVSAGIVFPDSTMKLEVGETATASISPIEVGYQLHVGARSKESFFVKVQYQRGIVNISSVPVTYFGNRNVSVSTGFFIKGKRAGTDKKRK